VAENKPRAFWFHYNKPLSRQRKRPMLTIHYMGKCHFVKSVKLVNCDAFTRIRKVQPRCVIAGKGVIIIKKEQATIYGDSIPSRVVERKKARRVC
jgi:hypothetical protein